MQKCLDLESKTNLLEEENSKLQGELSNSLDLQREFKTQIEIMKQDLELKNTDNFNENEISELKILCETLKNDKEKCESKLLKFEQESKIKNIKTKRNACENCSKTKDENAKLLQMYAELKNKYTKIELELNNQSKEQKNEENNEILELKQKFIDFKQNSESQIQNLMSENEKMRIEYEKYKQISESLKNQNFSKTDNSSEKNTKIKLLENELREYKNKNEQNLLKIKDLELQLEVITNTKEDIDQELPTKYEKLQNEFGKLNASNKELSIKLKEMEENTNNKETIEQLTKKLNDTENINKALMKKAADYMNLQMKYDTDVMALHRQKEELMRKLESIHKKCIFLL